jgi:hypothetical protein
MNKTLDFFFTPPVALSFMVLVSWFAGSAYTYFHRVRMACCDGCRIESLGGTMIATPHSCSSRHALYVDKKGNLFQFGRPVAELSARFKRGEMVITRGPRKNVFEFEKPPAKKGGQKFLRGSSQGKRDRSMAEG